MIRTPHAALITGAFALALMFIGGHRSHAVPHAATGSLKDTIVSVKGGLAAAVEQRDVDIANSDLQFSDTTPTLDPKTGRHTTRYRAVAGTVTFEAPAGMAMLSDDGCLIVVHVPGGPSITVLNERDQGRALDDTSKSWDVLPFLFEAGVKYDIQITYSQTAYLGEGDIDGFSLYAFQPEVKLAAAPHVRATAPSSPPTRFFAEGTVTVIPALPVGGSVTLRGSENLLLHPSRNAPGARELELSSSTVAETGLITFPNRFWFSGTGASDQLNDQEIKVAGMEVADEVTVYDIEGTMEVTPVGEYVLRPPIGDEKGSLHFRPVVPLTPGPVGDVLDPSKNPAVKMRATASLVPEGFDADVPYQYAIFQQVNNRFKFYSELRSPEGLPDGFYQFLGRVVGDRAVPDRSRPIPEEERVLTVPSAVRFTVQPFDRFAPPFADYDLEGWGPFYARDARVGRVPEIVTSDTPGLRFVFDFTNSEGRWYRRYHVAAPGNPGWVKGMVGYFEHVETRLHAEFSTFCVSFESIGGRYSPATEFRAFLPHAQVDWKLDVSSAAAPAKAEVVARPDPPDRFPALKSISAEHPGLASVFYVPAGSESVTLRPESE